MPCFFFILDTSASMSTRAHPQFSFFDLAKTYIETFIKVRSRNDGRMMMGRENDRYFLSTTNGKYPENIKVVSEKAGLIVVDELRKLVLPYGSAQLHTAILDAFRVLHVNRAQTGIDGVGTGRLVQNSEQIMIILLTDGAGVAAIPSEFQLFFDPPFLGSEMTKEAFRWDQKLYTVVFRIPSTPYRPTNSQLTLIDIDHTTIEKLCAKTGGRSFSIVSVRQINTSIDHILMTATQHKIGVRFDCLPTIHFTAGTVTQDEVNRLKAKFKKVSDKKPVTNLISRLNNQGRPVTCHWSIPESYFPMRAMDNLPQRTAHPVILCAPKPLPLAIRNDIPVDKLELEMGGVTEIIMEILQGRKDLAVWTYIEGSSNGPTAPFGCLRINTMGTGISLILLPFNFPLFYPLVEEVVKEPVLNNSQVWRARLDSYFQTVPYYYFTQMRICLDKIKVKVDYNSSMSNIYAGTLLSHLNRLKVKAKEEFDTIGYASKLNERTAFNFLNPVVRIERITSRTRMIGLGNDDDDSEEPNFDGVVDPPIYPATERWVPLYPPAITEASLDTAYRTPYTTNVEDLVSKLPRIQANLEMLFNPHKPTLLDMAKLGARPRFNTLEELHNMPQKHMGEYEPYQAARIRHYGQPMRKIDEEKDRTHAFGNPYKLKGLGAGIDEVMDSAVMDSNATPGTSSNPQQKRFGGDFRGGPMGAIGGAQGPPRKRRGPLGIDAFDLYRTRRSTRGSSSASSVASDFSEDFEGSSGSDFSNPGTPGGSGTPNSEFEDLQLQEMDTDEELAANLEEVFRRKKSQGGSEDVEIMEQDQGQKETPSSSPPAGLLTKQEILTRKIQIGSIVRRPANHRAFEEIMKLVEGVVADTSISLIQYAVRESQRFKLRQLTERLENQLR